MASKPNSAGNNQPPNGCALQHLDPDTLQREMHHSLTVSRPTVFELFGMLSGSGLAIVSEQLWFCSHGSRGASIDRVVRGAALIASNRGQVNAIDFVR
jgi:hypothetical protein